MMTSIIITMDMVLKPKPQFREVHLRDSSGAIMVVKMDILSTSLPEINLIIILLLRGTLAQGEQELGIPQRANNNNSTDPISKRILTALTSWELNNINMTWTIVTTII